MRCMMDHIALNVEDVETMIDFYTTVLGLAPERLLAFREGEVAFPSLRLNPDTIVDLFPPEMWHHDAAGQPGRCGLNHFCFSMERSEWEALCQRLETDRITIKDGPDPRWGAHGIGRSIYFRDPEGNLLEARYYEED